MELSKFDQNINKIIRDDGDAYWLRRWAGDALQGLSTREETNTALDVKNAIEAAEAMLKAFKDREKS